MVQELLDIFWRLIFPDPLQQHSPCVDLDLRDFLILVCMLQLMDDPVLDNLGLLMLLLVLLHLLFKHLNLHLTEGDTNGVNYENKPVEFGVFRKVRSFDVPFDSYSS